MGPLNGKRILLFAPKYYEYETFLVKGLTDQRAQVTFLENRPFRSDPLNKGNRWFETVFSEKEGYLRREILPNVKAYYDLCLVINLFSFHPAITDELRSHNPHIRCILYLWDNARGYQWPQFFSSFDDVQTFDPVEAKEFNIRYLPNFYPAICPTQENHHDLCFVGSFQMHRLQAIDQLSATQAAHRMFFYLYLPPDYNRLKYNSLLAGLTGLFPGRFEGYKRVYGLIRKKTGYEFLFHQPMHVNAAIKKISQSKCVLDLPFPGQTGSTQRVIQALALNKKVITTNQSVVHESFYHPDRIKVVPYSDLVIDWDWVNHQPKEAPDLTHLRIDNWLIRLLC